MATSIAGIDPLWGDGLTFSAKELRQLGTSSLYPVVGGAGPVVVAGGVVPGSGGTPLKVTSSGGMNVSVAAGFAVAQGTGTADQGAYRGGITTSGTITIPAADPTSPRRDLIVWKVVDNGDATSTAPVIHVVGTPAGSPVDPATPANAVLLARVAVAAGAGSVSAGNITDLRTFVVPAGGVVPTTSGTTLLAPFEGQFRYNTDTDQVQVWDGAAWQQVGAVDGPRGIVGNGYNTVVSAVWSSVTEVQVQSLGTVPMVSGRRYKITSTLRVGNANVSNVAGDFVMLRHKVDGTAKSSSSFVTTAAVAGLAPDCMVYVTVIDDATTGNHAVTLTGANLSGTGGHQLLAAATDRCSITVEDLGSRV